MAIPAVTREERALIKSYLLLMYIHKVFERDCRIIQESGVFKTPQLYVEIVGNGAKRAAVLLREVKQEFIKRAIKVYDVEQSQEGIQARYACRGYVGSINILWPSFREEMMDRMRAYLGLVSPDLTSTELSHAPAAVSNH
ncbi:hypothetical protein [Paenibacillus solani]|uniref:Uncharacterized protein n=1 Tax=Paenibacillus solani TaxID=1705565 RepID=A0A0M1P7F6_9BACL|nr:hypothetical protein [Paenibacillus solani]KOR90408.1 hypothetical protein AM231_15615 [Paenibacillus solani]